MPFILIMLIIGAIVNVFGNNEFLIDTNVTYVSESHNQESPSIAFDGTNYLIVWEDERLGNKDIYGARVNQAGVVLDPFGIVISNDPNSQSSPTVAFDGVNYLVAWEDMRNGSADIYGARVSQAGTVLDPAGIAISTVENDQEYPSIAFDGTNYLIVWQDLRNGSADIYGTRVTQAGITLDTNGIAISNAANWQASPSVAFGGTNYLVVWEDGRNDWDIYGARVNPSGTVIDSSGIPVSTANYWQWSPAIVFDGTNYLVVWEDFRNGPDNSEIYGTRISQTGLVIDPMGIAISTAIYWQWSPAIAFDGTNYLVTWEDERNNSFYDIYGARINQSGIVLDPAGIAILTDSLDQRFPSIAFDGINYLTVWQDFRNGAWDIYGSRISQSGSILEPAGIEISTVANEQESPSVAFDGNNYLVVWQDRRSSSYDIYGSRISQFGIVLDSTGFVISPAARNQQSPSVAFDGSDYLVVWEDYRNNDTISDIYGTRVSPNGIVLDSTGIAISTDQNSQKSPSVAFDGTNYLVVWQDYRNRSWDIYGTRVTQSGAVFDSTGIAISTAANSQKLPSVAFDGTNYLVVWGDERNGAPDIYGTMVTQSGTVLNPSGIVIIHAAYWQVSPSVAFDGSNYLIVWQDGRRRWEYDIYGTRVNQSGIVLDSTGIAISTASNSQELPSVAFDGINYLVVWQEGRNNDTISDVYGARITPSGLVVDSFAISLQSGNQFSPALAHGTSNNMLIAYSGWIDSINTHPVKTMRLWGKFYPFVGIDEESSTLKVESFTPEIYPNPAKSGMRVRCPLSVKTVKIFDISGKLIKEIATLPSVTCNDGRGEAKISLKGISPGIYFLQLGTEVKKFIVVR
jgi:large repetitive protein